MQKQNLFRFGFIALLLAASLVLLRSYRSKSETNESCCIKTCPKQIEKSREPGGMIWESLSRQFFSSISLP